jgi:23S rRNA (cytidine1920-2'-O)/16S rRNA (cytidine1409-2'-O)-methyltransferase
LNDGRVVSIENYNARYLKKEDFADKIDLVTIDVSFISQTLIIPKIAEILPKGASFVSLIKPQFEVGREQIGKKGIVKDESARDSAVKKVCDFAVSSGFELLAITQSPIHGGDGNIEFLAYFKRSEL